MLSFPITFRSNRSHFFLSFKDFIVEISAAFHQLKWKCFDAFNHNTHHVCRKVEFYSLHLGNFLHYLIFDRVGACSIEISLQVQEGAIRRQNGLFVHLTNPQISHLILIINLLSSFKCFLCLSFSIKLCLQQRLPSKSSSFHQRSSHFFIFL